VTAILGIETSCDETAAAVVDNGHDIRSSVVSSQVDLHARFGGVVPEIASRAHAELVSGVIAEALVEAGTSFADIDAVAACHGPGLAGALLVGVSAAKALSLTLEVRVSNEGAQAMYRSFGFAAVGIRKGYYAETNEDALVMWARDLGTPESLARLDAAERGIDGDTIVEPVRRWQ
jgi:hypothetical protein